jgi:hypothetical protein
VLYVPAEILMQLTAITSECESEGKTNNADVQSYWLERFTYINLFSGNIFRLCSCNPWQLWAPEGSGSMCMLIVICHSSTNVESFIGFIKISCSSHHSSGDMRDKFNGRGLAIFLHIGKLCGIKRLLTELTARIRTQRRELMS